MRVILLVLCCMGWHSWEYMEPRCVPVGDGVGWKYPRTCVRCKEKRT